MLLEVIICSGKYNYKVRWNIKIEISVRTHDFTHICVHTHTHAHNTVFPSSIYGNGSSEHPSSIQIMASNSISPKKELEVPGKMANSSSGAKMN